MSRGFSLIEMLVVLSIMLLMLGNGLAAYIKFNDRQQITGAARQLQVFLRSAQKKARVGDRPEGCDKLNFYDVVIPAGTNAVSMYAYCNDNTGQPNNNEPVDSYTLPSGIAAENAVNTKFYVLSGGASNDSEIILVKGIFAYEFDVTEGGEITEGELIERAEESQIVTASPSPSPATITAIGECHETGTECADGSELAVDAACNTPDMLASGYSGMRCAEVVTSPTPSPDTTSLGSCQKVGTVCASGSVATPDEYCSYLLLQGGYTDLTGSRCVASTASPTPSPGVVACGVCLKANQTCASGCSPTLNPECSTPSMLSSGYIGQMCM